MTESAHIVCPHCDKVNRVVVTRLADDPRCGSCKQKLFPGRPIALTDATFDRLLTRTDIPVVVDFWAQWCGPCKMMAPAFEQAAAKLEPQVRLAKLDTDAAPAIAARHRIQSIPTLVMFRRGKEVARQSGAVNLPQLVRWIESVSEQA